MCVSKRSRVARAYVRHLSTNGFDLFIVVVSRATSTALQQLILLLSSAKPHRYARPSAFYFPSLLLAIFTSVPSSSLSCCPYTRRERAHAAGKFWLRRRLVPHANSSDLHWINIGHPAPTCIASPLTSHSFGASSSCLEHSLHHIHSSRCGSECYNLRPLLTLSLFDTHQLPV